MARARLSGLCDFKLWQVPVLHAEGAVPPFPNLPTGAKRVGCPSAGVCLMASAHGVRGASTKMQKLRSSSSRIFKISRFSMVRVKKYLDTPMQPTRSASRSSAQRQESVSLHTVGHSLRKRRTETHCLLTLVGLRAERRGVSTRMRAVWERCRVQVTGHREPPNRPAGAFREGHPPPDAVVRQGVQQVLRLEPARVEWSWARTANARGKRGAREVALQHEHCGGALQSRNSPRLVNVLDDELVRLAHVCTSSGSLIGTSPTPIGAVGTPFVRSASAPQHCQRARHGSAPVEDAAHGHTAVCAQGRGRGRGSFG